MPEFSFCRAERLSSRKSISSLFKTGKIIKVYPFRILYAHVEEGKFPASVAISVPKRLFKKAVDRNLLKRRIREAYRLNKPLFYSWLSELDQKLILVIQYQHRDILDYQSINTALKEALEKLVLKLNRP